MELNELTYNLRLGLSATWKFYLLKYSKKGGTYSCDKVPLNKDYLTENLTEYLNYIIDKTTDKEGIIPYTEGVLSKGFLSFIEYDDDRVKDNFQRIYEAMENAGHEIMNSYNGYILRGRTEEDKEIVIINTSNPLVSLSEMLITPDQEPFHEPLLVKLVKRLDCVIIDGTIVGDTAKLENIFALDSSIRALCEANRSMVINSKVFTEASSSLFMNPRLIRSFQNVNPENLPKIKEKEVSDKLYKHARFERNADGTLHLLDNSAAKIMIKYLADKVVEKDGLLYEASTLNPLPILHKDSE